VTLASHHCFNSNISGLLLVWLGGFNWRLHFIYTSNLLFSLV
jgi:hypothetical protein